MASYDDYKNNKDAFDRFQRTEQKREKQRQIDYQNGLGPVKTAHEIEIAELDRLDAIWKKTRIGG
jgi:hypothetical protein